MRHFAVTGRFIRRAGSGDWGIRMDHLRRVVELPRRSHLCSDRSASLFRFCSVTCLHERIEKGDTVLSISLPNTD